MRNPRRITLVFQNLYKYWSKYPDLRLGQILANAASELNVDTFYLEDSDFAVWLEEKTKES